VVASKALVVVVALLVVAGVFLGYLLWKYHRETVDSDGDGIRDIDEVEKYGTNPNSKDTDNDGLSDYEEIFVYHTDPLKPNHNVKQALNLGLEKYIDIIKPLDNDGFQDTNEKQFIELIANNKKILDIPIFVNYLKEKASDGLITNEELKYSNNFSHLVNGLYDVIYGTKSFYKNILNSRMHDERFKTTPLYLYMLNLQISDPMKTIDYSSDLGLRLGFDKEIAKDATIKAIAYYGIAVFDRKLPENFDEISFLTKGTQIDGYGDKLVDFSPIFSNVIYPVDESHVVLVPDAGRETWMLAKHLKLIVDSGFNVLNHPEMFEALNAKMIANAYSIFDAPYGISYAEWFINGRTLKPTDKDVWDLIMLQWILYSNKAPQLGGGNKLYNRDSPWYDSDKLDSLYQDANSRRQALFFLFFLDNATFDMKKRKVIAGLEGAKTALIQAEEEYNIISSLYPDGKVRDYIWGDVPAWSYYYDWILDRGMNGLENTHIQYVGLNPEEMRQISVKNRPENLWNMIKDLNGVDQFITKIWKYWHLMKFAMGYERWNYVPGMIEEYSENYLMPQTLRAFGFPTYFIHIDPNPAGTTTYEWVVSLPDYVAEKLKSEFGDKIIVGPANGFGLYLCKGGLLEDGIKEIFGFSGGSYLYRDRDGTIKVGILLAPNFGFYFVKK